MEPALMWSLAVCSTNLTAFGNDPSPLRLPQYLGRDSAGTKKKAVGYGYFSCYFLPNKALLVRLKK